MAPKQCPKGTIWPSVKQYLLGTVLVLLKRRGTLRGTCMRFSKMVLQGHHFKTLFSVSASFSEKSSEMITFSNRLEDPTLRSCHSSNYMYVTFKEAAEIKREWDNKQHQKNLLWGTAVRFEHMRGFTEFKPQRQRCENVHLLWGRLRKPVNNSWDWDLLITTCKVLPAGIEGIVLYL